MFIHFKDAIIRTPKHHLSDEPLDHTVVCTIERDLSLTLVLNNALDC